MEQQSKYEAIGKFIYGFQRHHALVDELVGTLRVDLDAGNVLHEKLTGLEDALALVEDTEPNHAAIDAFLRHMRTMEGMNLAVEAFGEMSDEAAGRYAECAVRGHQLADAVRAGLASKPVQAPPA